jgi:hypothetical protein
MEYAHTLKETASKDSALTQELQRLEKGLAELTEIVFALDGRLTVVLREPELPQPRADNAVLASTPTVSQLVARIRSRVVDVEILCGSLSSIVRRLDI